MESGAYLLGELVFHLVCAVICSAVASSKGRSAVGWFFLGLVFHIIPTIIILCVANLKTQNADRQRAEIEAYRLREQLRQERLKNEAFRQYSAQRLDAHDHVLGVDTRTAQALPAPGDGSPEQALTAMAGERLDAALPAQVRPQIQAPGDKPRVSVSAAVWYYEFNGAQQGPVSANEIKSLLEAARIQLATLVWTEGLADWVPVSQIPWFRSQVAS